MTTIILANDHELLRECVAHMLRETPGFSVISQCGNVHRLLGEVNRLHPNVVVLDITMADLNAADATRRIHEISPATRVIALSGQAEEIYLRDLLDAGISGYVLKSGRATDLADAIRNGSKGKVYFSREISEIGRRIQNNDNGVHSKEVQHKSGKPLSPREREILQLIGEGCSSLEIAIKLNISDSTTKTHRNNLMDKLNVRDVAGLTRQSVSLKLVFVD